MTRRWARRPRAIRHSADATPHGRQARKKRVSTAFIKFVVDQSDKFGVFVSHRLTGERSYFNFASVARAVASLLMTVPIGTARAAAASA